MNRFDDQRAWFCERVNENSGGLYWLAKSILHNDEDIKDAVQDSVLTAYEKLDTLRDEHIDFSAKHLTNVAKMRQSG